MLTLRAITSCTRRLIVSGGRTIPTLTMGRQISSQVKNLAPLVAAMQRERYRALFQHQPQQQQQQRRWCIAKPAPDSSSGKRIYYGTLTPRMRAVKIFSLTTSLAGLAAQPILMEQGMKMGGTGMAVFLCGFAGFFTFVTPFLLHFITKKYVTEIYYNSASDEYTATTISIILQKIQTKFRRSDVHVPDVPGMFTSFLVGKKAFFVDPSLFEDPEHYVKIMGFDKPIDFKLDLTEPANKTPSTTPMTDKKSLG